MRLRFPRRRREQTDDGLHRAPRRDVRVPVRVNFPWGTVDSYAVNISYSGLLVQAASELPKSGDRCELVVELPPGTLKARGYVTRLDPEAGQFAIELTHMGKHGLLLLSTLLAHLGTNNSLPPLGRL